MDELYIVWPSKGRYELKGEKGDLPDRQLRQMIGNRQVIYSYFFYQHCMPYI